MNHLPTFDFFRGKLLIAGRAIHLQGFHSPIIMEEWIHWLHLHDYVIQEPSQMVRNFVPESEISMCGNAQNLGILIGSTYPIQAARHHQEYCIFSKRSIKQRASWVGGRSKIYTKTALLHSTSINSWIIMSLHPESWCLKPKKPKMGHFLHTLKKGYGTYSTSIPPGKIGNPL